MAGSRERFLSQSLGVTHNKIKQSRVLLVGAGGIGCELLKNLMLTGFGEIHIVDLDTIDLSNLNRQFLFRQEHIKKSKALVAKESAKKFNPNTKLEAHHGNIKDSTFNISWFKTFDLVFNALDNLDARRHVNKMCLLADVPLIESGTTGFDGQVQVIKKGKSECYDCNTKAVPKSFPVCTIRSTPSQPIHCIVWAKSYLFSEIFGTSEDDSAEIDSSEDPGNIEEMKKLREEAQMLKQIRQSIGQGTFVQQIFEKVYVKDIERLRSMEGMWRTRKPPTSLSFSEVSQALSNVESSVAEADQSVWSLVENFAVFSDSLRRLSSRYKQAQACAPQGSPQPILEFDKDDDDTLDFVAAAANLRSLVFGIEPKSKFEIKQMAGNIIPAIATTNAMTAGLCVLQALKVIRDQLPKAKMVFLERSAMRVINAEALRPPNPECGICGVAQGNLVVDPGRATLGDLVEDVLKVELGYSDEFSVRNDSGILYDPDFDDNLTRKLSELGIGADSVLTVMDEEDDNPRVNVSFSITEQSLPQDSKPLVLPNKFNIARRAKSSTLAYAKEDSNGNTNTINGDASKRKRNDIEDDQHSHKKGKTNGQPDSTGDDVVVVDDSAEGTILIDD